MTTQVLERVSAPIVEPSPLPEQPRLCNDISSLLVAYYDILHLYAPPASLRIFRRRGWRRLHGVCSALRPQLGYSRFIARHICGRLAAIDRMYATRTAAGRDTRADEDDLASVARMRDALPPSPPRWFVLAGVIGVILLTQAILQALAVLTISGDLPGAGDLSAQLTAVMSPNVTSIDSLVSAIAHAYPDQLLNFFLALGLAGYLLLRLPVGGLRLGLMVINAPGAMSWRHRRSPLAVYAASKDVSGLERRVYGDLDVPLTPALPVDLFVKAALLAGPMFYIVYMLRSYLAAGGEDVLITVLVFGVPVLGRLAWLLVASARRHSRAGFWLLLLGCALVVVPGVRSRLNPTPAGIRAQLTQTTNATGQGEVQQLFDNFRRYDIDSAVSLQGIDLSGRDLDHMDLHALDLRDADLAGADLADSNLSASLLVNASLAGADLAGADIRGVDLQGAELAGADLRGARLAGSDLQNVCDDSATVWPPGISPASIGARVC